ncbi:GNAT family N-acetyltransferase [Haematomicrobium sanguinis]|uniref:GNAT family N-acetyltransferase n=1 Tax=Haematomicrobium sanguinis TaxID=479106 RepID=UPI0005594EA3|nr:GNAT family N-acetyltransferase [Haematomicrobium sanguinis]
MNITYRPTNDGITPAMIEGFFVGWPNAPTAEKLLSVMEGSYRRVWALHDVRVVGFVNAISDGVCNAFLPWLEVLPEYQGRGIGTELVRRITDELREMYAIDVCCDPDVLPYYQRRGFIPLAGAGLRNPQNLTV